MSDELAAQLSQRLKETHRRLARLDVDPDEKGRLTRRLIALTDASKHDIERASARLDRLLADLDQGRVPAAETDDEAR